MSEQETKIGKLKLVDLQNKTIEQYCEEHCISRGRTKSCYETWEEFFFDINWGKYVKVKDKLFQIIDEQDLYNNYYTQIDKIDDDTYSFYSTYYNGGTCLTECLEYELEKML